MIRRMAILLSLWLAHTPQVTAGDDAKRQQAGASEAAPSKTAETPSRELLERRFSEMLSGAVLEGTWQVTGKGGLRGDAPLSQPKAERYAIRKVHKVANDYWLVQARIQFADKDVTVPVPVRVVWAEDTPVITLNELTIPMLGTYSARVMVHEGFYSGIWYSAANNYGGVMSGRIVKDREPAEPETNADETNEESDEQPEEK